MRTGPSLWSEGEAGPEGRAGLGSSAWRTPRSLSAGGGLSASSAHGRVSIERHNVREGRKRFLE